MENHELPTSEWEHGHAIEAGDELIDTVEEVALTVTEVHDDGSVTWKAWEGDEHGVGDYITRTMDENAVRIALADGILERTDGLSHELSSY